MEDLDREPPFNCSAGPVLREVTYYFFSVSLFQNSLVSITTISSAFAFIFLICLASNLLIIYFTLLT